MAIRQEITYSNSDGEPGQLSGKAEGRSGEMPTPVEHWVKRTHPERSRWVAAEARMRASYIGTRSILSRYIVPHRFEGGSIPDKSGNIRQINPANLTRAQYGYGINLNQAYLHEIFGHVRGAAARYFWGPLAPKPLEGEKDPSITGRPAGGLAQTLWDDATKKNETWPNFFHRKVLDWICSSPGGIVIIDSNARPDEDRDQAEDAQRDVRPYLRFVPWSVVEDYGYGEWGFRWIKLRDEVDRRSARKKEQESITVEHVLYELDDAGETVITRWDEEGKQVGGEVRMGRLIDMQGRPSLPVVEATLAEHPEIALVGSGLILGLDDIVIDLYNTLTEVREGFRDASFSVITYRGENEEAVREALATGSRYIDLGSDPDAALERDTGATSEVDAGLALINMGLEAWKLSAKRRAQAEVKAPQSGIALQAEFHLDLVPLLREVAGRLDEIETNVMYIAAQVGNRTLRPDQLSELGVKRDNTFRPEDEATRISRIINEFRESIHLVPAEAKAPIILRWLEATELVDLDEEVDIEGGGTMTRRQLIEEQVIELAEAAQEAARRRREMLDGLAGGGGRFRRGQQPPEDPEDDDEPAAAAA